MSLAIPKSLPKVFSILQTSNIGLNAHITRYSIMGLFSALLDQLKGYNVNHAHGSNTLPKISRGTPNPSLTSIYLYNKAKRASTAHASHAQHQQIPSKIEAGKDQLKTHRKRKAVEAVGGKEKVSKKIKVRKSEQNAESDAILSHAVSFRSPWTSTTK